MTARSALCLGPLLLSLAATVAAAEDVVVGHDEAELVDAERVRDEARVRRVRAVDRGDRTLRRRQHGPVDRRLASSLALAGAGPGWARCAASPRAPP